MLLCWVLKKVEGFQVLWPSRKSFFETSNAKFIEDAEYGGSSELMNFVFEEEYVIIPIIANKNDQVIISNIIPNANPDN